MGIKEKVRRASKIFSSDSKENLVDETAAKETSTSEVNAPEAESVPEPETAEAAEEVVAEAETAEVAQPAEIEETVNAAESEVAAETEAVAEAETEAEAKAEAVAEEATPKTGEDAIQEVKKSAETKEVKKNDFFKKLLLKFKRPVGHS